MPVQIQRLIEDANALATTAIQNNHLVVADEDRLMKRAEVLALIAIAQALHNQVQKP